MNSVNTIGSSSRHNNELFVSLAPSPSFSLFRERSEARKKEQRLKSSAAEIRGGGGGVLKLDSVIGRVGEFSRARPVLLSLSLIACADEYHGGPRV